MTILTIKVMKTHFQPNYHLARLVRAWLQNLYKVVVSPNSNLQVCSYKISDGFKSCKSATELLPYGPPPLSRRKKIAVVHDLFDNIISFDHATMQQQLLLKFYRKKFPIILILTCKTALQRGI